MCLEQKKSERSTSDVETQSPPKKVTAKSTKGKNQKKDTGTNIEIADESTEELEPVVKEPPKRGRKPKVTKKEVAPPKATRSKIAEDEVPHASDLESFIPPGPKKKGARNKVQRLKDVESTIESVVESVSEKENVNEAKSKCNPRIKIQTCRMEGLTCYC